MNDNVQNEAAALFQEVFLDVAALAVGLAADLPRERGAQLGDEVRGRITRFCAMTERRLPALKAHAIAGPLDPPYGVEMPTGWTAEVSPAEAVKMLLADLRQAAERVAALVGSSNLPPTGLMRCFY